MTGYRNNVLIVQSGGCTAVMNKSLVGAVQGIFEEGEKFGQVYGAVRGLGGILEEDFFDLRKQSPEVWGRIANTPGAVLGSSRRRLRADDTDSVMKVLARHNIGYLFAIGGNDTAETALRVSEESKAMGKDVVVVHIPKTIDNDLAATDHTPGYGSAARFLALATMGAGRDAEAMGEASPLTVIEVMGRDAGWLAASAALGKRDEMDAPHYVCIPEVQVDEGHFLQVMEEAFRKWGCAVAVTAENARGPSGPLGRHQGPFYVDDFGHEYYEGPGRYLAQLLSRHLKARARFEKPGTIQRSLMACVSGTDAREAMLVGRDAVKYALRGHTDSMVTLERQPGKKYQCSTGLAPLREVAGRVKAMPPGYFDPAAGLPTPAFLGYARPLIGGPLPRYGRLSRASRVAKDP